MQTVTVLQETATHHEDVLNSLLDQLHDYENRDRRQNIHIHGLSKATRTPDLLPTVQGFFSADPGLLRTCHYRD